MYDNIGGKIKGLAKASFIVAAIAEVITGIALMATDDDLILYGLLVMVVGPIVAWVSSFLLYGFGELIDKASEIEKNTRMNQNNGSNENGNFFPSNNIEVNNNEKNAAIPVSKTSAKPIYSCISINSTGKESHGTCVICKSSNVDLEKSKIQTEIGTRTLDICKNCYQQFYAASTKK